MQEKDVYYNEKKKMEKQSTLEKRDNEAEKSSKVVLGSGVNNIAN